MLCEAHRSGVVLATTERRIGRYVALKTELSISIGIEAIKGGVRGCAGAPACGDVRSLKEGRQWCDAAIKGANEVPAELYWELQSTRSEIAELYD